MRRQPLTAIRALRNLVRDPTQTEQVFVIMRSLTGNAIRNGAARFTQTSVGKAVLAERRDILDYLTDWDRLAAMPEGSLGRCYLDFARAAGIKAQGLVEASEVNQDQYAELTEDEGHYAKRLRDTHDLWHVAGGYTTEPLGEVCVVAFSCAQTKNLGFAAIAVIGALKMARERRSFAVFPAVWQAYRIGQRAAWLPGADWEALLTRPLDDVRAHLDVHTPTRYAALRQQRQQQLHPVAT